MDIDRIKQYDAVENSTQADHSLPFSLLLIHMIVAGLQDEIQGTAARFITGTD